MRTVDRLAVADQDLRTERSEEDTKRPSLYLPFIQQMIEAGVNVPVRVPRHGLKPHIVRGNLTYRARVHGISICTSYTSGEDFILAWISPHKRVRRRR